MAVSSKHFRAPVELLFGSVAVIQAVANAFRVLYERDMLRVVVLAYSRQRRTLPLLFQRCLCGKFGEERVSRCGGRGV